MQIITNDANTRELNVSEYSVLVGKVQRYADDKKISYNQAVHQLQNDTRRLREEGISSHDLAALATLDMASCANRKRQLGIHLYDYFMGDHAGVDANGYFKEITKATTETKVRTRMDDYKFDMYNSLILAIFKFGVTLTTNSTNIKAVGLQTCFDTLVDINNWGMQVIMDSIVTGGNMQGLVNPCKATMAHAAGPQNEFKCKYTETYKNERNIKTLQTSRRPKKPKQGSFTGFTAPDACLDWNRGIFPKSQIKGCQIKDDWHRELFVCSTLHLHSTHSKTTQT